MAGENAAIWKCTTGENGTESAANSTSVNNVLLFNDTAKIIAMAYILVFIGFAFRKSGHLRVIYLYFFL